MVGDPICEPTPDDSGRRVGQIERLLVVSGQEFGVSGAQPVPPSPTRLRRPFLGVVRGFKMPTDSTIAGRPRKGDLIYRGSSILGSTLSSNVSLLRSDPPPTAKPAPVRILRGSRREGADTETRRAVGDEGTTSRPPLGDASHSDVSE